MPMDGSAMFTDADIKGVRKAAMEVTRRTAALGLWTAVSDFIIVLSGHHSI